jgi:hypothetical protein
MSRHWNTVLVAALLILWAAAVRQYTMAAAAGLGLLLCLPLRAADSRPVTQRAALLALLLVAGLALKDLWPITPAFGAEIRTLGPSAPPLPWLTRNPDLPAAAMQLGALLLGLGLAFAVHERVRNGKISARRMAAGCLAATWAFALLLLIAEAVHIEWSTWAPAVASKNAAATLAALGIVLQLDALRQAWREAKGLGIGLIGLGIFIRALATLNSGTGLVAAAVGSMVYLASWLAPDRNARPRPWIWISTGVASVVLVLAVANPNLAERALSEAPSFRMAIWQDCARLLGAAPAFGVGCGAFAAVHPLLSQLSLAPDRYLAHPDSGYVMLVVEWGLIPSALLAAACGAGVLRVARKKLEAIDHALLAGLATLAAAAITDPTFQRMPTFFLGCVLAGAIAGRISPVRGATPFGPRTLWLTPAFGLLGLAAVAWGTLAWDQLKWRPLSADLQARTGAEAWRRSPGDPVALARLHASVTLRPWSADFATYAALQVHSASAVQAAPLWQLAFARGREAAGVSLSRGQAAFPATPLAYWADLALAANPDIALQLEGTEPFLARRIAQEWLVRRGHEATPSIWRRFVSFCVRNGQTAALQEAVPLLPADDVALQVVAGRALQTLGKPADAWTILARAFPLPPVVDTSAPASPLSPKTLVELGRFDELRRLASQPQFKGPAAIEILRLIVLRPDAPPWFRLRLAHAYAAENNWNQALAYLPQAPRPPEAGSVSP